MEEKLIVYRLCGDRARPPVTINVKRRPGAVPG